MFEAEQGRPFKELIKETIDEANFLFGYGRYYRKHVNEDDEYYAEYLIEGKALVRKANAIREALRVIATELTEAEDLWKSEKEGNKGLWTREEEEKQREAFEARKLKIEQKFVSEAWRLVSLRDSFEENLQYLELKPRKKYQRKPEEEPY